jgi:chemotaxis protein CheD
MSLVTVGLADSRVSNIPEDVLITYALGSCVAILIHDPCAVVGGILHFVLPSSRIDREKAESNPFHFADTGIPLLFERAYQLGAKRNRLVVSMAGGSQIMDPNGAFQIGKGNYMAARRILLNAGVALRTEEVGGTAPRTVCLEVGTGRTLSRNES